MSRNFYPVNFVLRGKEYDECEYFNGRLGKCYLHTLITSCLPQRNQKSRQQLAQRSDLQAAYQELRQLKFAFKSLPSKKAPRNYTLKPEEKKEKTSFFHFLVPAFGFSSAVAAILLAITLFFQLSPSGSMISQAPEPAMMAMEQESGQSRSEWTPSHKSLPGGVPVEYRSWWRGRGRR